MGWFPPPWYPGTPPFVPPSGGGGGIGIGPNVSNPAPGPNRLQQFFQNPAALAGIAQIIAGTLGGKYGGFAGQGIAQGFQFQQDLLRQQQEAERQRQERERDYVLRQQQVQMQGEQFKRQTSAEKRQQIDTAMTEAGKIVEQRGMTDPTQIEETYASTGQAMDLDEESIRRLRVLARQAGKSSKPTTKTTLERYFFNTTGQRIPEMAIPAEVRGSPEKLAELGLSAYAMPESAIQDEIKAYRERIGPKGKIAEIEAQLGRKLTAKEKEKVFDIAPTGEPLYPVMEGANVVYRPRSQAAGSSAPRTLFGPEGLPSVGGQAGYSTLPPPILPEGTQQEIAGILTARDMFQEVEPLLGGALGPAIGRIKLAEIIKLGGLGASRTEIDLANKLQRLVTEQAFTRGGKQLTPTEKEQFEKLSPQLSDTIAQATIKTRNALTFLDKSLRNRMRVMSPRQRAQFENAVPSEQPATGAKTAEEYLKKIKK